MMFTSSSGVKRSISGGSELTLHEYPSPQISENSLFGFLIGGRFVRVVKSATRLSLTWLRFFQASLILTSVESRCELERGSSRISSELNVLKAS